MKKFKIGHMVLLIFIALMLCTAALPVIAASKAHEADKKPEEEIVIFDPGVKNVPQDSEEVYLYPAGNGSYVEVQQVSEPGRSQAELAAEGTATEEHLTPVQIDENTYAYSSEDRSFTITLFVEMAGEAPGPIPLDETKYDFGWQLQPGEYTHGATDLGGSGDARRVYVNGNFSSEVGAIGFYAAEAGTYYWIEPPCSEFPSGAYFLVSSSDTLQFALKNCGEDSGTYSGQFWKTL